MKLIPKIILSILVTAALFFSGFNKIKLLELNGVAPTRENVANKTYPYSSEFYAVTAGIENTNTEALIRWILSEQGQYLIEKTGYTPLQ